MGLLPETVRVAHGRILLEGIDLLTLPPEDLYGIRGRRIAMMFQEPMSVLNPLTKVSVQKSDRGRSRSGKRGDDVQLSLIGLHPIWPIRAIPNNGAVS
jgi:ABC-type microcin C transport system duplicated ATPase subunit YejF